jgi:hypothetical protein
MLGEEDLSRYVDFFGGKISEGMRRRHCCV